MTYEPMSPHEIERNLRICVTELTRSEKRLKWTRDCLTEAERAYQAAKRRAMFDPRCPKVNRSNGVTTAERDAWVEEQCAAEIDELRIATATRDAAQDHSRTVRDVCSTYQTIASLCKASLSLAGSAG